MAKNKSWLKWSIQLLITVVLLGVLLTRIPFAQVWHTLTQVNVTLLMSAMLLQLAMRYSAALRMRILVKAQGIQLKARQLFEISCVSTFYGLGLPGELGGGAIRWHRISAPNNKPAESFLCILVDRAVDTLVLLGLGLMFWCLDPLAAKQGALGVLLMSLLLALGVMHALMLIPQVTEWVKVRLPEKGVLGFVGGKFIKLIYAAEKFQDFPISVKLKVIGYSILRHLIGFASLVLMARAIALPLEMTQIGWIRSILLILSMLPIAWAGLGVREVSLLVLLEPYGVAPDMTLAWSFLLLLRMLWIASIGAGFEVFRVLRNKPIHSESVA